MFKTAFLSATALLVVSAAPVSSATAPAQAAPIRDDRCLLIHGCYWTGSEWICANPQGYVDCVFPADGGG